MHLWVPQYSCDVFSALDQETLKKVMLSIGDQVGCYFQAFYLGASAPVSPNPVYISNYPEKWVAQYMEQKYFNIDPVLAVGITGDTPFSWNSIIEKITVPAQIEFMKEAAKYGMSDGYSTPLKTINGFALHSLCGIDPNGLFSQASEEEKIEFLRHFSANLFEHTVSMLNADLLKTTQAKAVKCTSREQQCVQWVARGKNGSEIGTILGISPLTVNQHIKSVMQKYGVDSRPHLIARLLSLGIITF